MSVYHVVFPELVYVSSYEAILLTHLYIGEDGDVLSYRFTKVLYLSSTVVDLLQ
jgi:hypothetical protein